MQMMLPPAMSVELPLPSQLLSRFEKLRLAIRQAIVARSFTMSPLHCGQSKTPAAHHEKEA